MRSPGEKGALRALCMGVGVCLVAGTSIAQVTEQKLDQEKYQPNLLPVPTASWVPAPQSYLDAQKLDYSAAQAPTNDDCASAIDMGTLPAFVMGTTVGASVDAAPFCGTSVTAPGVWYTVTGTGNTITASMCAANGGDADYDSKLNVYCGSCGTFVCVGGNDDTCGLVSEVSFCTTAGETYYILVHGYSANTGSFTLALSDNGVACGGAVACSPCVLECPPGGYAEGETDCYDEYNDIYNGGCNSAPPVFLDMTVSATPLTICGTSGNFLFTDPVYGLSEYRDTDWYRFTLTSAKSVTFEGEGDFPLLLGIVDTAGIDDCNLVSSFLVSDTTSGCGDVASVTAELSAGTWYVFVSTADFVGTPCGSGYWCTTTANDLPTGAACVADGSCMEGVTESDAIAMGWAYQGDGTNCGDVTCPIYENNDFCADAIAVGVPSLTPGTTVGATADYDFPVQTCGTASITSPGVWYSVVGTGNTMTASLCNGAASYDSKLSVYCGTCADAQCVDGNDDFCGLQSQVTWCSQAGANYLVLVHGYGGASGSFELEVTDSGSPCTPDVFCLPVGACCGATLPDNCTHTVAMQDSYGDGWNGGTLDVLVNGSIVLNDIYAVGLGSSASFSASTGDVITTVYTPGSYESENTYQIIDGTGAVIASDGPYCGSGVTATANCPAGGGGPHDCTILTEADCIAYGGTYLGDDTNCGGASYNVATCSNPFEDISGTGSAGPTGDDGGMTVPIGFPFTFYGIEHEDIGISTNGYATFGSDQTDFSNDAIPDDNDPNDFIAPLWDDMIVDGAPGAMFWETRGSAPNRYFVIQWDQIRELGASNSFTYEAILHEGTNDIEFRYLSVVPESYAGDYTAGIENPDGTSGVAIDASTLVGGECYQFTFDPGINPCNIPPVCEQGVSFEVWSPNHKYTTLDLKLFVDATDADGDALTYSVTDIRQDEPVNDMGDGNTTCDGEDMGDGVVKIRTERKGGGNGRVYHIGLEISDGWGGTCYSEVLVYVPHDQGQGSVAIDDGPLYDSTWCGEDEDVNFDRQIDQRDLNIVMGEIGQSGPDATLNWPDGDVDHDGTVTSRDVKLVLQKMSNTGTTDGKVPPRTLRLP